MTVQQQKQHLQLFFHLFYFFIDIIFVEIALFINFTQVVVFFLL